MANEMLEKHVQSLQMTASLASDGLRYQRAWAMVTCPHRLTDGDARRCGLCDDEDNTVEDRVRTAPRLLRERDEARQQRDELANALQELVEAHEAQAKASMSLDNAVENFDDQTPELDRYQAASTRCSDAEKHARTLLAKTNGDSNG